MLLGQQQGENGLLASVTALEVGLYLDSLSLPLMMAPQDTLLTFVFSLPDPAAIHPFCRPHRRPWGSGV